MEMSTRAFCWPARTTRLRWSKGLSRNTTWIISATMTLAFTRCSAMEKSYRFLTKLMYFTPCAPPTIMTLCCASAGGAMENTLAHPQAPLLNPSPALASEEHAETEEYVWKIVLLSVCRRNMPPHSCCWLNPSNNTRLVLCSYERRSVTDPETFSPQNQEKCPNRKIRNK